MKRTKQADSFVVAVGARARSQRERLRLSQAAVASQIKATHSVVSRIESGERDIRLSELFEISRALRTTPSDLVKVEA